MSLFYPSLDSLFSCDVNCGFSSLTCRHISSPAVLNALSGEIHAWVIVSVCMCVCLCHAELLKLSGLHCVWPCLVVKLCPTYFALRLCLWALSGCVSVCKVGGWWWGVLEQVVYLRVWHCTSAVIWEWDSCYLRNIIVHLFSYSSGSFRHKTLLTSLHKKSRMRMIITIQYSYFKLEAAFHDQMPTDMLGYFIQNCSQASKVGDRPDTANIGHLQSLSFWLSVRSVIIHFR